MAETVSRLYKLQVDATAAARQLGEISRATDNLDKRMAAAASAAKAFGAALAAAVSVGAIVSSIRTSIDAMDELAKAVQKVGIGAEDLQKLRYAADLSGVAAETLDKSIGKLAVSMSDLETGTTDAHKALRAIGVQSGDSAAEALAKIADQFAKMPDGIDKTALAIKLFGKAGADLIPLLNGGAAGLKELGDEAERFGHVLSGGTLKVAEEFNDNLDRLGRFAKGATDEIVDGMLPALAAITLSMTGATEASDGFVESGARLGEMLGNVYGFALKATATLQAFGMIVGAIVAASAASPSGARTIIGAVIDDVNKLEADTNKRLADLAANFERLKKVASGPGEPPAPKGEDTATAAVKGANAAEAAAKAADKHRQAEEKRWKILIESTGQQERLNKVLTDTVPLLNNAEQEELKWIEARRELNKLSEDQFNKQQEEARQLQLLTEWLEEGTDAQKEFARAQLAGTVTAAGATESIKKQRDELDVLTEGFENFFDNLARGTASVEDLFKRMVQSILAELLKLWAKKYIIDAIFGTSSGGAGKSGPSTQAFTFPTVATTSAVGPSAFATSTSAGATIEPLRFSSPALGMQQQQPLQVTINNNAPGVQVDTRQSPDGLEVIITQVKQSLAADVLRGGNDFAHASERAWGLTRGNAAAF